MFKKTVKLLLTVTLTVSMLVPSVTVALADVDEPKAEVTVDAREEDQEVHVEDIITSERDVVDLRVDVDNGHKAVVTTGNLEAENASAVEIKANSGTADVYIDGDAVSLDQDMSSYGVSAFIGDNGDNTRADLTLTVKGNTQGATAGAFIEVDDGSTGNVVIDGSSIGINNTEGDSFGLQVVARDDVNPGDRNKAATAKVVVKGDSVAIKNKKDKGAVIQGNGGFADVSVGGNVSGDTGLEVVSHSCGEAKVVVEGTVYGETVGVSLDAEEDAKNSSVTVWKIETGKDGAKVGNLREGKVVEDKEAEKKIQYIIKVDQPTGATLTATDANGKALATVTAANGKTFEYAHSGDKVLLKVDVDSDYSLDAVYGDEGQQYKLVKDDAGNYYIEVPAGGGVYFSAVLSKAEKNNDNNDDNSEIPPTNMMVPQVAPVYTDAAIAMAAEAAVQAAVLSISSTPAGGSANIAIATDSIDASVVRTLLERRDINVSLACFVNGKLCIIIIPAGADLSDLIRPDGTIDIKKLAKKFGKMEVN